MADGCDAPIKVILNVIIAKMDMRIHQAGNNGLSRRIDKGRVCGNRDGAFATHALDLAVRYDNHGIRNGICSRPINQQASTDNKHSLILTESSNGWQQSDQSKN